MHFFDRKGRFFGGNAIVGGGLPLAIGIAMADKELETGGLAACFFGEGRGRRRRVPREHEPRPVVGTAGSVRVREQSLRHGHAA